MVNEIKTLVFSNTELILLSMLLGADKIVGINDVEGLSRMDERQLSDKWDDVKGGLQKKGYVGEEVNDVLQVDETVCALIDRYINSNRYLQIQVADKGIDIANEMLFFSNGKSVNFKASIYEDSVTIPLDDETTSPVQILQKYIDLHSEQHNIAIGDKTVLSKAQYYEFMSYMNLGETEKSAKLLADAGMEKNVAFDAAKSFFDKNRFVSIIDVSINAPDVLPQIIMFFFGGHNIFAMNINENDEEAFVIEAMIEKDFWETVAGFADGKLVQQV